jgi:D-alanyl-D-alanine carboxypeptidase
MEEQVFGPLGMDATGYDGQPAGLATGYLSPKVTAPPFHVSVAYAAYGLYSTVDDVYRWSEALYGDELLPAAQREALLGAYKKPAFDPVWDYGYGAVTSDAPYPGHRLEVVGIPGSIYPGFWSSAWSFTDLDITVIILANRDHGTTADPFNDTVANFLLAEP